MSIVVQEKEKSKCGDVVSCVVYGRSFCLFFTGKRICFVSSERERARRKEEEEKEEEKE